MAYIALYLILVSGKVALMYGVWRLAKSQGRSLWPPLIASIFCASIVFFALFIKGARNALRVPSNSSRDTTAFGLIARKSPLLAQRTREKWGTRLMALSFHG